MAIIKNTALGINIPIKNGSNSGYFEQSTNSYDAIKNNITNLLQTIPGERRLNPEFGSRLWTVVFEPNDDFLVEKITKIIKEDVEKWIYGISVTNVNVKYYDGGDGNINSKDIYKLYISVSFTISSINQTDMVELILDTNKA